MAREAFTKQYQAAIEQAGISRLSIIHELVIRALEDDGFYIDSSDKCASLLEFIRESLQNHIAINWLMDNPPIAQDHSISAEDVPPEKIVTAKVLFENGKIIIKENAYKYNHRLAQHIAIQCCQGILDNPEKFGLEKSIRPSTFHISLLPGSNLSEAHLLCHIITQEGEEFKIRFIARRS